MFQERRSLNTVEACGEIKFTHALTLVKVKPAARPAAIAIAKASGKVTNSSIAAAVRQTGAKTSKHGTETKIHHRTNR